MNKKEFIYDIETLINFECFVFVDLVTDETFEFLLYDEDGYWDLDGLVNFLLKKPTLIGYNVLKFDGQVLQFILENYQRWKYEDISREQIITEIYQFSQRVIELTNNNEFAPYPEWKLFCKHIDVYTIFHFDNRAKATSLKWLQFMIDWPDLREMPIEHYNKILPSQINSIVSYCINDTKSTKAVFAIAKGETELKLYKGVNKLQLRKDIQKKYNFPDSCINWNDVKIGDQMNMKNYLKKSGLSNKNELYELKHKHKRAESFTFGDCFPVYMEFKTKKFKDFIESFRYEIVRLEDKEQEYQFTYKQTTYTVAKGGLHSNDPVRIVIPNKDQILRDADVGSMYPNALRKRKIYPAHLGPIWLEVIEGNIQDRLSHKDMYKLNELPEYQSVIESLKLALNGGAFGKLREKTSWQEDEFACMKVTIGSQIDLLMLIEAMEFEAIPVISANTDGIVCLFEKAQEEDYTKVCKEWEKKVGNDMLGQLEYTDYTKLIQLSVNDYLAIKSDGKTKEKGDFLVDFELHKNKSWRVVPLALKEYFVNGTQPETFLIEHISKTAKNIFDFCGAVRGKGGWYFEERKILSQQTSMFDSVNASNIAYTESGERLQKTIRYYISNKGNKLIKCHPDGRQQELQAGPWLANVFNIYEEKKDYDINYTFYLEKIYTLLNKLDNKIHL